MAILNNYRIRFEKSFMWRLSAFLLDTLGAPLAISFSRKKEISKAPKILAIRKDDMGDAILSLPIYEAIKKKYPNAKISVMASKYTEEVFKNNPYIDELILVEPFWKKNLAKYIGGLIKTSNMLKKKRFDIGIDPKGSIINILLMYFAMIKQRISYWNVSGGKCLLTDPVFYNKQVHEIEANLNLLKSLDINSKFIIPKLYLNNREKFDVKKYLKKNKLSKFIAIYAVPSRICKSWENEKFSQLIKSFPDERFLIVGSDKDEQIIKEIINGNENVSAIYNLNIRKLSYLFSFAKAVVAVDGGPMHLAWISNKKVIALFGQNDIKLWKPLNGAETICYLPESEQGINRKPLNLYENNKYMEMISVDDVYSALRRNIK